MFASLAGQKVMGSLRALYTTPLKLPVSVCRPQLMDMAEHPEGFAIESEQALLVVCSTQVPASQAS